MKYSFLIVFLFLLTCVGYAQRIAYVDQNLAIKDAAELKKAEAEMKKIVQSWKDTLGMLKKNFAGKYAAFQKDSSTLSQDDMRNRVAELRNMQLQAKQYEQLKVNSANGGDYVAQRTRLLEPLGKKFREAVAAVAKSEKIDIVLSKEKIIATPDAIDLTAKVAEKLK
jgi:Outer membrane protein